MPTLRELIDAGYRIAVHHEQLTPPCAHYSWLDLEALAVTYGDDFDLSEHKQWFLDRLRCSRCKRKGNMTLRLQPNTEPH